jgi:DNA polymerase-1
MQTYSHLSLRDFKKLLAKCSGKPVVLDTESTGLQWWSVHLTTVGFHCPAAGIEGTVDIGRPVTEPDDDPELLEFEDSVRAIVKQVLKPGTTTIFHNAKFDMSLLGVDPVTCYGWKIMDTTVMIHLWDSRAKKSLEIAERELLGANSKRAHIEQAPTDKKIRKKVWLWPSHIRQDYCVNDCRVTYQLADSLAPLLKKTGLWQLLTKDMKYMKLVYKTEHYGWNTDPEFIGNASMALQAHKMELEQKLWDGVGYEFNWRSHQKLSYALYENLGIDKPINPFASQGQNSAYVTKLGFKRVQELKGGMYNKTMTSTFLLMEKVHHPLGELVAALREADKLVKQLAMWQRLMDENSIIHTNYNVTGTRTGRLSSSKPNLANIPSDVRGRFTQGLFSGGTVRSNEYNLRMAYIARPGKALASVDYTQMEMRMFGIESQDPYMLEALRSGVDIHLFIAHKVWGECGKELDKIHREWSKTIGFGLIYGMTTGSLEHKLGMTRQQAQQVTNDYWGAFPRIRPWLFETVDTCKQNGFIRYWSGRIWREDNEMFMYKGANALIQGGCADLLSIAAMRVEEWLLSQGADFGRIISFVYDELIIEVDESEVVRTADEVAKIMQVPDLFGIPFLTDKKIGYSYGNLMSPKEFEEQKVGHIS